MTFKQVPFGKVLCALIVKYLLFAVHMAFIDNRFIDLVLKKSTDALSFLSHLFYYAVLVAGLIVFLTVLFIIPYFSALDIRNNVLKFSVLGVVVALEFYVYTFAASTGNYYNGTLNAFYTILFLLYLLKRERPNVSDLSST